MKGMYNRKFSEFLSGKFSFLSLPPFVSFSLLLL